MASNSITLGAASRNNLLSLQGTTNLIGRTQSAVKTRRVA